MKKFMDFLNEADATVVKVKSDKIGNSTEDNAGMFLKVDISGDKVTFSTPDGRDIVVTNAKELISASGLQDGQYAQASAFPAFNGETKFKYSKAAKGISFLDIKVGMGSASIGTDGNRQWKDLVRGGWNAFHGGEPGMARYKMKGGHFSGPGADMPVPGDEIDFELPNGGKGHGTVVKLNGAAKILDVKDDKGKKIQVSMYIR
ncbi:hypothetical protein DEEACLCL_00162 [Salmonella phage CRW-SP2]|nr:hypothetical protein DEEACLCL_00162 [Salmonella phage CRW-SP2]